MYSSKTNNLMVGLVCLFLAQACTPTGPFDGNWTGRTRVSRGECGESELTVLITGNKVGGALDIYESQRTVSLNGKVDDEGRINFSGRIGDRDTYRFEGRFRDEHGLIQADPGKTGTGGALSGVWRKIRLEKQLDGGTAAFSMSCTGAWSVKALVQR